MSPLRLFQRLCKAYAVKQEVLAEYTIALQIIKHNGKKLGYFLADKWFKNIDLSLIFRDDASRMRLLDAKIHAVVAGLFGDFGIDRASELLTCPNISRQSHPLAYRSSSSRHSLHSKRSWNIFLGSCPNQDRNGGSYSWRIHQCHKKKRLSYMFFGEVHVDLTRE